MTTYSTTCDWTSEKPAAKPSRIKSLFASLMHEIEIRRALREVGALDEAALHDIGISAGNLEDAVRCGRH
ncbi:DUF1127 domain-containing protein [Microvirga zambiensis]|uniref:DUF1127 domain-containing protein n=1 Tax=Microvirga zambiensis TaxID=1402137 RepID=UPI001FE866BD|nr:DUF1127 domain-containing protein [Microvirga zambiensis]